jgi:glutathione peroxidase-family protein
LDLLIFWIARTGTNEEIASFAKKSNFPMMDKVSVKGGDMCAMYQFLTKIKKWIRRFRCGLELPKIPNQ